MTVEIDTAEIRLLQAILDEKANVGRLNRERDQAIEQVAQSVAAEVRSTAAYRTGALRGSIRAEHGRDGEWRVLSPLKQALFQEIGTSNHPPQPAFLPAGERGIGELQRLIGELGSPW